MIGEKIALYRKQKDLTQEQLGEMLGFSNRTISKWESGASLPGVDALPGIADALDVSLDELFGVDTKPRENEIADIIKETIRSELLRLIPEAVENAVEEAISDRLSDASFSSGVPDQRVMTVVGNGRIIKTYGEAMINGPLTFNDDPDRWLLQVLTIDRVADYLGDYGTKEEAEAALLAFLNAYMSGQECFWFDPALKV